MNTTDTHNPHAFMLCVATNDALTGGNKADLLVGNAGDGTLNRGDGEDVILGGTEVGINSQIKRFVTSMAIGLQATSYLN